MTTRSAQRTRSGNRRVRTPASLRREREALGWSAGPAIGYQELVSLLVETLQLKPEIDAMGQREWPTDERHVYCARLRREIPRRGLTLVICLTMQRLLSSDVLRDFPVLTALTGQEFAMGVVGYLCDLYNGERSASSIGIEDGRTGPRRRWMPFARARAIDIALRLAALERLLPGVGVLATLRDWLGSSTPGPLYAYLLARGGIAVRGNRTLERQASGSSRPRAKSIESLPVSAGWKLALQLAVIVDRARERIAAAQLGDTELLVGALALATRAHALLENDERRGLRLSLDGLVRLAAAGVTDSSTRDLRKRLATWVRDPVLVLELHSGLPGWRTFAPLKQALAETPKTGRPADGFSRPRVNNALKIAQRSLERFDVSECVDDEELGRRDEQVRELVALHKVAEARVHARWSGTARLRNVLHELLILPPHERRAAAAFFASFDAERSGREATDEEVDDALEAFLRKRECRRLDADGDAGEGA